MIIPTEEELKRHARVVPEIDPSSVLTTSVRGCSALAPMQRPTASLPPSMRPGRENEHSSMSP